MTEIFQIGDLVRHKNDHAQKGEDWYAVGYVYGYEPNWLDNEVGIKTMWMWKEGDLVDTFDCIYTADVLYKLEV